MISYICLQLFRKQRAWEGVTVFKKINVFYNETNKYVIYWTKSYH